MHTEKPLYLINNIKVFLCGFISVIGVKINHFLYFVPHIGTG